MGVLSKPFDETFLLWKISGKGRYRTDMERSPTLVRYCQQHSLNYLVTTAKSLAETALRCLKNVHSLQDDRQHQLYASWESFLRRVVINKKALSHGNLSGQLGKLDGLKESGLLPKKSAVLPRASPGARGAMV